MDNSDLSDLDHQVIIDELVKSEVCLKKCMCIASRLKISQESVLQISRQLKLDVISYSEAFRQILSCWKSQHGHDAKLQWLLQILDDCKCKDVSDCLRQKFKSSVHMSGDAETKMTYLKDDLEISSQLKKFLKRKPQQMFWKRRKQYIILMTTKLAFITDERLKRHAHLYLTTEGHFKDRQYPSKTKCLAFTTTTDIASLFDFIIKGPKKIMIVTEASSDLTKLQNIIEEKHANIKLQYTHDTLIWTELCEDAKNKIMDKTVEFAGQKMGLWDFLREFGVNEYNANNHIQEHILVSLITDNLCVFK